jgi:hypothetical protein
MTSEIEAALVRGLQARNRLLLIHALIGIEVGLFVMFTGGPHQLEAAFGPWVRVALGLQAILPGALTLVGLSYGMQHRAGRMMAFFGLLGLLVWQLSMATIFIYQALTDGVFLSLGEVMPPDAALSYVPWVYVNLAALMVVHLIEILYSTFWREYASGSIHLGRGHH